MTTKDNPQASRLFDHTERALLVKILSEMRVQTLLMAQAFGFADDVADLRSEVMTQGNATPSDV